MLRLYAAANLRPFASLDDDIETLVCECETVGNGFAFVFLRGVAHDVFGHDKGRVAVNHYCQQERHSHELHLWLGARRDYGSRPR